MKEVISNVDCCLNSDDYRRVCWQVLFDFDCIELHRIALVASFVMDYRCKHGLNVALVGVYVARPNLYCKKPRIQVVSSALVHIGSCFRC